MTPKEKSTNINHATYKPYIWGFIGSIFLTLIAFYFAEKDYFSDWVLIAIISTLAIGQLFIQLVLFLHLGKEPKPHWNTNAFLFMVSVVVIIVFGSIWIMRNLDYHHGIENVDRHIMDEENIYR